MRYRLWILFFFFMAYSSFSYLSAQTIDARFNQANNFYKEAQYKKAIELYEEILKQGKISGPLYYNLGNAYFKDGQLGRAVVSYQRARQWMPRDSDLKANEQYVEAFIKNNPQGVDRFFVARLSFRYFDAWTLDELAKLNVILYFLALIIFLAGFYLKKKELTFFSLILGCLFVFHSYAFIERKQSQENAAVIIQSIEAKFEPMESATTHFSLSEGVKVKILEQEGFWSKIERRDGKKGWVPKSSLEKI
ncbi:MAG TPA: tetratricopeptide repeat protein [Candidatus Omnitrophota bacterium]|nr:tetratricopeptide repeat protein [Candidatus Omnitrophota bacterium]HPN88707.1 tetratricopeptide repeat protein [Candidatus Omnitrophota bacterium]